MHIRKLSLLLYCFVIALGPSLASASAQQTGAPASSQGNAPSAPDSEPAGPIMTLKTGVRLVVLDGFVLDRKGNVVTNLKREDFQIMENGSPQRLRNFEQPGGDAPAPEVTVDSTSELNRLAPRSPTNIVVLDEFNTSFTDMAFARYSLKSWLDKQPSKLIEPTMLVAVDLQHFEVLQDYTQNKAEILTELERHFAGTSWQTAGAQWDADSYNTAFLTLRRVAEAVVGHRGHTNIIWLGRGFPPVDLVQSPFNVAAEFRRQVQLTINELNDARVTLYTVDPGGVTADTTFLDRQKFSPTANELYFQDLALATGGRNLFGRNDVDREIGTTIRDGSNLYVLTYQPSDRDDASPGYRSIQVTVGPPGMVFVTRQGYYPEGTSPPAVADTSGEGYVERQLMDAGASNMGYGAVAFSVISSPADANDVSLLIEPKSLTWVSSDVTQPRTTKVDFYAALFDKKGKELEHEARKYSFSLPASASPNSPVRIRAKLTPDAKAVRARIVVRVEGNGHIGAADLPLNPGAQGHSPSSTVALPTSQPGQ